ncbi:MAG: hypothetical protein QXU53_07055 [Thermosphaera sp.]
MSLYMPPTVKLAELSSRGLDSRLADYVKSLMSRVIAEGRDGVGGMVESYLRKALRTGAWRALRPESRALLLALRRWKGEVKSRILQSILLGIYVEIELHTTRGRAIFYGILEAARKARELLADLTQNISKIITMGIQYMNLPQLYRIHG